MPENKRQHFVPQNYLREFSADGESIGVLLVESGKCVEKPAPINSQAQQAYFYGKDLDLEKELSNLEGLLAENRRTIFDNQTDKLNLYQREVLYQDMMLQLSRTKYLADLYEQAATIKARTLWKHGNEELIRKHAKAFGVKFSNPIIAPMMILLKNLGVCFDLEFKVLRNKTGIPFVTSDNPVCPYNQYFEAYNKYNSGLASKGEQIYYPLSPSFAVFYYDPKVYTTKYRRRYYLDVTDISDINNLNGLVCARANKCVYYHIGLLLGEHVEWTFEHIRESRTGLMNETELPISKDSSIVIIRYPFPALRLNLSFLKFQDRIKPYDLIIKGRS